MAEQCSKCLFLESYRDCNGKERYFCGLLDIWNLETGPGEPCEFFEPAGEVLMIVRPERVLEGGLL
jgi:hypothetical protein